MQKWVHGGKGLPLISRASVSEKRRGGVEVSSWGREEKQFTARGERKGEVRMQKKAGRRDRTTQGEGREVRGSPRVYEGWLLIKKSMKREPPGEVARPPRH